MKKSYETIIIVKPTLTEEETTAILQKYGDEIASLGGELQAKRTIGLRRLAYPIRKHERGYYALYYYVAPPTAIAELERKFKYDEDILRFMTVKYSKKKELVQYEKQVAKIKGDSKAEESSSNEEQSAQAQ